MVKKLDYFGIGYWSIGAGIILSYWIFMFSGFFLKIPFFRSPGPIGYFIASVLALFGIFGIFQIILVKELRLIDIFGLFLSGASIFTVMDYGITVFDLDSEGRSFFLTFIAAPAPFGLIRLLFPPRPRVVSVRVTTLLWFIRRRPDSLAGPERKRLPRQ